MSSWPRLLALCVCALPAFSADLEVRYSALEKMLAEQLFTQEGRRYVKGTADSRCQYAYLESPHLDADQDRLRLSARFSGRSAWDLFGRCVGLGDSFDLNLTSVPAARDGAIVLQSVKVSTWKNSYYIRRVRAALEQGFSRDFKIEVKDQARKILEQAGGGPYGRELAAFDLNGVRVAKDALILVVDFKLVIK
jgi:hypothetical protein